MYENRRAQVIDASTPDLELQFANTLLGTVKKPSRPLLGNATAGWHYQPILGDEVYALGDAGPGFHTGSVSVARPSQMVLLNPGEMYQGHKDGRFGSWLNTGVTTLLQDAFVPAHTALLQYDRTQWVLQRDSASYLTFGIGALDIYAALSSIHGNATVTGLTKTGTLELTNTTTTGSVTLTGTCTATGTDNHGDTVTVTGTCQVVIADTWSLVIDGTTHKVALLT